MVTLRFERGGMLSAATAGGAVWWPAGNNVDSHSQGPWPLGTFQFVQHVTHDGDSPASAYGSHGGLLFDVPGRVGMEIHSGRLGVPDGLGRTGIFHCTLGCIRTVDQAVADLLELLATEKIDTLTVA